MNIQVNHCGPYGTNIFTLTSKECPKEVIVIDCAQETFKNVTSGFFKKGIKVHLLVTHGHWDHVDDLHLMENLPKEKCDMYMSKIDHEFYLTKKNGKSKPCKIGNLFEFKKKKDSNELENIELEIMKTKIIVLPMPGHTKMGVVYYFPSLGKAFVGDSLFKGSVGRCDLPGGDMQKLIKSLEMKILTLPNDTECYPGHGPSTTVAREKKKNPYL